MFATMIYEKAGYARSNTGHWIVTDFNYTHISEYIYRSELIAGKRATLFDLGFDTCIDTVLWPNDEGINVDFDSKISKKFTASIDINDEIDITIYNDETEDCFTLEEFITKFPKYISKLPARDTMHDLFSELPQPIAEELTEYYSFVFVAR